LIRPGLLVRSLAGLAKESKMKSHDDFCLTSEDVSRLCAVTTIAVHKWRETGKGPAFRKVGGRFFYEESAVLEFAAARLMREKRGTTIKTNAKLRRKFAEGAIPILASAGLNLGDAKKIAMEYGYSGLQDLDEAGVSKVIAKLKRAAKLKSGKARPADASPDSPTSKPDLRREFRKTGRRPKAAPKIPDYAINKRRKKTVVETVSA
jgi:hypothetical protein